MARERDDEYADDDKRPPRRRDNDDDEGDRPARRRSGGDSGETIPNYLVQSIAVTVCCCLPLGIVAIIHAAKVNGLVSQGDMAGAREASASAKKWSTIGFVAGLIVNIIVIGLQVALGGLAANAK
jgi:Interferon-induced transmembrane protein